MIPVFEGLVLGTVQGITEFLPISSTAHLVITQTIFKLDQSVYGLTLDLFTSLGTTVALLIYFRNDIGKLWKNLISKPAKPRTPEQSLPWWILGVTLLVAVAGVLAEPLVEGPARSMKVIAAGLMIFGIVMWLAERYAAKRTSDGAITMRRTYLVGLAQILAFIPGISRSGATISTGLFLGMDRVSASRLSFILSTPIMLAAIAKRGISFASDYSQLSLDQNVVTVYVVSAITATIVGYLTIHYLLQFLQKHPLTVFVGYRFALAIALLLWFT